MASSNLYISHLNCVLLLIYIVNLIAEVTSGHPVQSNVKSELHEKAKTFGQSADEMEKVNYYLKKIRSIEINQHPEEFRRNELPTVVCFLVHQFDYFYIF